MRRTLLLGDTDGDWNVIGKAFAAAAKLGGARIVSVGDSMGAGRDARRILDAVARAVDEHDIDVLVCEGNHEQHDLIAAAPTAVTPWDDGPVDIWVLADWVDDDSYPSTCGGRLRTAPLRSLRTEAGSDG